MIRVITHPVAMSASVRVDRLSPEKEKILSAHFQKHNGDFYWILDHMDELVETHANKYIAVKNLKVRAADTTLERLKKRIRDSGNDLDDYIVEFIQSGEIKYLF